MLALVSQTDPVRGETFSNVKALCSLQYARNFNVVIQLKSHSPLPPREGRHKVGKMDPSIFRPEITYGMLRIVI